MLHKKRAGLKAAAVLALIAIALLGAANAFAQSGVGVNSAAADINSGTSPVPTEIECNSTPWAIPILSVIQPPQVPEIGAMVESSATCPPETLNTATASATNATTRTTRSYAAQAAARQYNAHIAMIPAYQTAVQRCSAADATTNAGTASQEQGYAALTTETRNIAAGQDTHASRTEHASRPAATNAAAGKQDATTNISKNAATGTVIAAQNGETKQTAAIDATTHNAATRTTAHNASEKTCTG